MSTALRPVLRAPPQQLSSTSIIPSTRKPSYICQSCRHAHLIRRPKRPYTFTQLVTLSDGSAFTMRTTSPQPVYRSTRDTRNAPLWNPSSKELTNVEDDEAGRLAKFRERFGRGFDAAKGDAGVPMAGIGGAPVVVQAVGQEGDGDVDGAVEGEGEQGEQQGEMQAQRKNVQQQPPPRIQSEEIDDGWDFGDEDANMLDLISSYGQENIKQQDMPVKKGKGKK